MRRAARRMPLPRPAGEGRPRRRPRSARADAAKPPPALAREGRGPVAGASRRRRSPPRARTPRAGKSSTARTTRPCARSSGSTPGSRAARELGHRRARRRDRHARPDAGGALRLLARGRAERGLLRAACPSQAATANAAACSQRRDRRRPDRRSRRARGAEAAARGSRRPQDRPELQIRLADVRAARHRDRALRRHDADVLCARCRRAPITASMRSRDAISITQTIDFNEVDQAGQDRRSPSTAVEIDKADRICRRGRRRHAAALARVEAAAARRAA